MNTAKIEACAVRKIEAVIDNIAVLKANFDTNDKTPSWDGNIVLYKNSGEAKADIEGEVRVQIKGKIHSDFSKNRITYPIEVADLQNYRSNGGALYFVVYINNENFSQTKVYYVSLTPVKIDQILKGKERGTKAVKLEEFPEDAVRRLDIVCGCLFHNRRQASFADQGFISIEEIRKSNLVIPLHMPVVSHKNCPSENELYSALFGQDKYLYAEIGGKLLPTDVLVDTIQVVHTKAEKVSVKGTTYYNTIKMERTSVDKFSVKIGDSTEVAFDMNVLGGKVHIRQSNYLRKREVDLRFLIAAVREGGFNVGPLFVGLSGFSDFNIAEQESRLAYWGKVVALLDLFSVAQDVDLDKVSKKQYTDIDTLISAFLDKRKVNNLDIPTPSYVDVIIADLSLRIVIIQNKEDGSYEFFDFFDSPAEFCYKKDDVLYRTTVYSILQPTDYLTLSNIPYAKIVRDYRKVAKENSDIFDRANLDMLNMLLAYDQRPNSALIQAVQDMSVWLNEEDSNIACEVRLLNQLQIAKRQRTLIEAEIFQLYSLVEDPKVGESYKTAAYLLLDNQKAAEIHFNRLSDELKQQFKQMPISTFWKNC